MQFREFGIFTPVAVIIELYTAYPDGMAGTLEVFYHRFVTVKAFACMFARVLAHGL